MFLIVEKVAFRCLIVLHAKIKNVLFYELITEMFLYGITEKKNKKNIWNHHSSSTHPVA